VYEKQKTIFRILPGGRKDVKHDVLSIWNLILDYDIDSISVPGQNEPITWRMNTHE
jgi:hypothetical protein